MSKIKFYLILCLLSVVVLVGQFQPQKAQADYSMYSIVSDGYFTNYNSMTVAQINNFLIAKGSVFANYTIPQNVSVPYQYSGGNWGSVSVRQLNSGTGEVLYGKTVAQLIYNECQSHHINPQILLAIMQKESSTIEQSTASDTRLAWPMFYQYNETMASFGYSKTDAQSIAVGYGGVGQQISYAIWAFRSGTYIGYDTWANKNWGAVMNIDGTSFNPQSIATRLLYTYTPHSWQTFLNILTRWGWNTTYQYSVQSRNARTVTLNPGSSATFNLKINNTGTATWRSNVVYLGTSRAKDRTSIFKSNNGTWLWPNRIKMRESSVLPGGTATYTFTVTVPANKAPGTYREYFQPVADGYTWMDDLGIYWDIKVPTVQEQYQYNYVSQNFHSKTIYRGSTTRMILNIKNTGTTTWKSNTVYLGTSRAKDRTSAFTTGAGWRWSNRISMLQSSVAPGEVGTFSFYLKVPTNMTPGTYREYFQPVADGYTWMSDLGIYWDLNVK